MRNYNLATAHCHCESRHFLALKWRDEAIHLGIKIASSARQSPCLLAMTQAKWAFTQLKLDKIYKMCYNILAINIICVGRKERKIKMDNNMPGQNPHSCDHCNMNGHNGCCGHGHHRYFVLRWVLGLLILAIVFCLGLKIGEFKSEVYGGNYGGYGQTHRMMPYYQNQGWPVMYQSSGQATVPPAATQTPTK